MASNSLTGLKTRQYENFRGVDFSNNNVSLYRSPNGLNMWKNYEDNDSIQTRPGMELLGNFGNKILGLFFYVKNNTTHVIVHSGTKLYEWDNYPNIPATTTELYSGMNIVESKAFIYKQTLYILDGTHYLNYNGTSVSEVEGTIPITSYYKNPDGSTNIDATTDSDLVYQDVNVLTSKRKNVFVGDGSSTEYVLDTTGLDSAIIGGLITATIDGVSKVENVDFLVNRTSGKVTFNSAPSRDSEVVIEFSKTISGHRDRILNCTLIALLDNRVFFSGNPDYPNAVFHCELDDPKYIRDTAYYECGIDSVMIKAIIPGNNVLWVIKEMNQNSSSVFYLTPTYDATYGKIYPSVNGSIALGCISTGINFNDDVVFFSSQGLEGIANSSLYSEQILQHRSSFVDARMLNDTGYTNVKLAEYKGYLMCLINSHIYLADKRAMAKTSTNDTEYEWFYWELPNSITFIKEYREDLYLGNASGDLFMLGGLVDETTDEEEGTPIGHYDISSVWTTAKDDFGYMGYTKTTNKRGNVANLKVMNNDSIHVDTIVDGVLKEKKVFSDTKGYIAFRIKDKKFKSIQLKFSSNKPFGLFSCTLQGFVASYIKR